ncbi:flagellar basal-body rod protein FlgF [Plesiomonas shigelloides]|uniref:flagellar basal-body rod protein FlgF n=1 Tax=Plesiomonas shigelloides TaxID=703 RepID=UPI002247A7CF|nr:flagellar basal-body rod protein FlgF [Plesiomonas shigelloides]MCX2497570.1 flagellar basal-body rod protein FlgF [Plesiomonas shigelloides]
MDKLLFTALSGARRTLMSQQVQANNLANVNTTGFRADLEQASTELLRGAGYQTRALVGEQALGSDFSGGALQRTDRPLDVAIQGDGFFAVETPQGEAYTRAGNFTTNDAGELSVNGHPLMGTDGPIVLPEYSQLTVGKDGTLSIVAPNGGLMQEAGQLKLVNPKPDQIAKSPDGLFRMLDNSSVPADDGVQVASGYLESSNVNAVDAMIRNMTLARNFELQVKMMKTAEDLTTAGNRLIRE